MPQIKKFLSKRGISLILSLSILTILVYVFFAKDYKFVYVDGISMKPTHEHSDHLVYQKKSSQAKNWRPYRNSVVVAKVNNQILIKRIVGLPGETIEIKDGYICINNKKLKDKFSHARISIILIDDYGKPLRYWKGPNVGEIVHEYINNPPIILLPNQYWIIGDNRSVSWYGTVSIDNIKGTVIW